MNSEEVNSTQSVLQILHCLQNIVSESSAKALEQILKDRYTDVTFLNIMRNIMMSPQVAQLSKEAVFKIKSSAAIMLNRCFILQAESNLSFLTLEQSVQFYLYVLFSMDISICIKRMLQPSFQALLKREQIQLADFFQEAFQTLVRLVQLHENRNDQIQNQQNPFDSQITFRKGVSFKLQFDPTKLSETYQLIIMLVNNFIGLFVQKNAVYQQKILETWKICHALIFREQTIQMYPSIIQLSLRVWDNYIFDGIDLNKKLMPSYRFIYDWQQLSRDLIFLLNYKALKVDLSSNTYNYFFINEDCENTTLMQLKQKAVDIFSTFLKILQAVQNSAKIAYSSSFFQSFQLIQKSLLTSISYSVKHKNSTVEQSIDLNILNLFSIWIQLKNEQISEELRLHFLLQVVIPVIQFELKLYQDVFGPDGRGEELILELNDCCQYQNQLTKLSIACKILQALVEESNQLYLFVKQYALTSIMQSKIENYQLRASFDLSKLQRLSNPTSFLMLSVTNYNEKKQQDDPKFNVLAQLINQTYFPMFSNYEKQYLFFFCGFAYSYIFQQNKQPLQYLMQISLSNRYGSNVKRFAFDFLINVCDNYFSPKFTTQFLIDFFNTNFESKWSIVCKMFRKYLENIDENDLCQFVSAIFNEIQTQAEIGMERRRCGQPIKCKDGNLYLSTCRQISNYFDEIKSKTVLQNLLLNSVQYLRQVFILSLDDSLIGISSDIIENTHLLPDNFIGVLEQVKQAYFNNEYRGRCYQTFYSSCLEALNKTTPDQDFLTQILAIYDVIIEAIGYVLYYPDSLTDDHYEDISCHVFLLQKLYMLYGDKISNKYRQQTLHICKELINRLDQEQQPLILSRLMNMILLCKITIDQQNKQYPINEIYRVARNNRYRFAYDSCFLIFLLTQITPVISQSQRLKSVVIIISVYDSWKKYSQDRNVRAKQRYMRQNAILSYVLPSVTLQDSPLEQMKSYINQLKLLDPEWFQSMQSQLTEHQITILSALQGQSSSILPVNNQNFDLQEGSSDSYSSNEATLNDLNPNKFENRSRKIIKVSRGFQNTLGRIVDVPTAIKRHYKDECCIDQQQPIRSHGGKKLKIQSSIIHQISKREIVNGKIAKKSQRS